MIEIPRLSENDLEIFRGKQIVICGMSPGSILLYKIFKHHNLTVWTFLNDELRHQLKAVLNGYPTLDLEKLRYQIGKKNGVILQSVGNSAAQLEKAQSKADMLGCELSPYTSGQLIHSFHHLIGFSEYENLFQYLCLNMRWHSYVNRGYDRHWLAFFRRKPQKPVIICSPPKTADTSLDFTFDLVNENHLDSNKRIEYLNVYHKSRYVKEIFKRKNYPVKIITGVREPISQNLSMFFQQVSDSFITVDFIMGMVIGKSSNEKKFILNELQIFLMEKGCELQFLWELYIDRYIYPDKGFRIRSVIDRTTQAFFSEYAQDVCDITKYPFDKEKGYTIIKNGNAEIFIYQLEKLNDLAPELSAWLGTSFDEFVNANRASDKWIAESYKQAQKEIEITQEYFDKCFDEPYVKHCYSEADIEKFKEKWRGHIK